MTLLQKIMTIVLVMFAMMFTSTLIYDLWSSKEVTIIVDIRDDADPFETIPHIIPRGSSIISVRECDKSKNEYVLKVRTKNKKGLLEWLLGSRNVEGAKIRDL